MLLWLLYENRCTPHLELHVKYGHDKEAPPGFREVSSREFTAICGLFYGPFLPSHMERRSFEWEGKRLDCALFFRPDGESYALAYDDGDLRYFAF